MSTRHSNKNAFKGNLEKTKIYIKNTFDLQQFSCFADALDAVLADSKRFDTIDLVWALADLMNHPPEIMDLVMELQNDPDLVKITKKVVTLVDQEEAKRKGASKELLAFLQVWIQACKEVKTESIGHELRTTQ